MTLVGDILIVLLVDFLCASVLFFMFQFLHLLCPQLVEPDASGRGKIVGTLDPLRWCKAARCAPNHAIADGCGIVFGKCHWACVAACAALCVHVPCCVILYLMSQMSPYALPWRAVAVCAVAVLLVLLVTAAASWWYIESLHRAMAPQFDFAAAVRSWADSRYSDDKERMQAVRLIFRMLDVVPAVARTHHEPTPDGGREAVMDVMGAVVDKDADWLEKLSGAEFAAYESSCERL